jgi:DNA-binding Lrp family transcriptional regulator
MISKAASRKQHRPETKEAGANMMRAYVLIESIVGKANAVAEGVKKLKFDDADVVSVDAVTGPFDVIALLESDDLDKLGRAITDGIQQVEGVQRTTTCLVVRLG